jgi:hypothetical protein
MKILEMIINVLLEIQIILLTLLVVILYKKKDIL